MLGESVQVVQMSYDEGHTPFKRRVHVCVHERE